MEIESNGRGNVEIPPNIAGVRSPATPPPECVHSLGKFGDEIDEEHK
jgi:hypothetical protein